MTIKFDEDRFIIACIFGVIIVLWLMKMAYVFGGSSGVICG